MASPNPKPREKKKLQGTDRADRDNENRMEPMKIVSVPEPPEYLGKHGRDLWQSQLKQLAHLQMLTVVDLTVLGQYCKEWDLYREAIAMIDQEGYVNKHDQISAHITTKEKAFSNMLKIADRFGFVASAREKISMPQRETNDPLQEHLNKKTG